VKSLWPDVEVIGVEPHDAAAMTLSLEAGTVTALIGPNGTGKSSLLKAAAGLIRHGGRVQLSGGRGSIVYMPQDSGSNSSLTVLEVILLGRLTGLGFRVSRSLVVKAEQCLDQFGLHDIRLSPMDVLSGGQRQMVFLAQVLFREPAALLLDEPTAALDLRHQLLVLEAVRQHSCTRGIPVIAAMHDLSLAAHYADRVLCLSGGRIVADSTPESVLTADRLRAVYGVEASVAYTSCGTLSITPLYAA